MMWPIRGTPGCACVSLRFGHQVLGREIDCFIIVNASCFIARTAPLRRSPMQTQIENNGMSGEYLTTWIRAGSVSDDVGRSAVGRDPLQGAIDSSLDYHSRMAANASGISPASFIELDSNREVCLLRHRWDAGAIFV